MMSSAITFQTDQFGAVIFPPLVEGATEMVIWQAFAQQVGNDAATALSELHGYDNACLLALAVYHATQLCRVADGDAHTVTEAAVREAIASGVLFNLRPLSLEDQTPTSFARRPAADQQPAAVWLDGTG